MSPCAGLGRIAIRAQVLSRPMSSGTPGNKEPMSGLMGGSDDSVHQS